MASLNETSRVSTDPNCSPPQLTSRPPASAYSIQWPPAAVAPSSGGDISLSPALGSPAKGHELSSSGAGVNRVKAYQHLPHSSSTFSQNKNQEYEFLKPPECPIFRPNEDEFKNPLTYISKIRPIAERYGIAKILPPKMWTPPFTVDVDKLKFTPRVQRLNELEAKTRVKLNFLDQIAKFWELQGSSLKIPMVERKALDLYSLHRIVQEEGGLEQATKERKWSKVAHRMQYPPGKSIGAILKGHYERILHPFDIYTSGKVIDIKLESESDDKDYKPHGIVSRQQITPPNETTARRSKRFANMNASKESACGLGTISANIKPETEDDKKSVKSLAARPGRGRFIRPATPALLIHNDPLAKYICHICNRGDVEEAMLLCDGCDDSYHTFCLLPPLHDIPKGDWRCPRCVVEEVSKPTEAFGFEQAQREYTLQQFGEMADQFKADYFHRPVHLVPTDLVEREFWRIVSSIDEDVTVEYGADLHTMDHGSGFPTKSSLFLLPGDQEYAESSWNLNNLPLLEDSILGHINADISGMKVPWMYVGMCFATFCWHNEDHWSYSINYLHWGEPKTWYGVPGSKAETFEKTMKSAAPELFASQPDLLHQLVTIMNPNILMNSGVPVYRTDQHAGEFVITFPRAYHAGFNQGYNFAEAVNFAPADWLKMGRDCINHYSMLRRFCVFSHDELVCKMALEPDKLNFAIATACYIDMVKMVDSEKKLRKSLLEWGVTKAEREAFELIPDDERQCEVCKTTCFLSAVACQCTKQIVCLRHYSELCECKPESHLLQYRYTLDEMPLMLKKLQAKAHSFELWLTKCRDVIDPPTPGSKITLEDLQELVQEADRKKYPSSLLIDRLNSAVLEAEKCVTVIQQLDINKVRTRTRHSNDSTKYKLTMDELELFVEEIDNLCCVIKEGQSVRELLTFGKSFVTSADALLSKKINKVEEKAIEKLIDEGQLLCIELHELKNLRIRFEQVSWYNKSRRYRNSSSKLQISDVNRLIQDGQKLIPDPILEKEIGTLQGIVLSSEAWEKAAKSCFQTTTPSDMSEIELILEAAEKIVIELPTKPALKEALKKSRDWLAAVEMLQKNEHYPYYHTLEAVVNRGLNIPLKLEELDRMKKHLDAASEWKDKTAKSFLRKHTRFTLLEVLSPRTSALMTGNTSECNLPPKRTPPEEQFTEDLSPAQMVDAFKKAEEKEITEMRELRRFNSKASTNASAERKYCFCKGKFTGQMYLCQLCADWYHRECVPKVHWKDGMIVTQNGQPVMTCKYLCPSCMRSRRPRLEAILSLLVSLQRLPIRLPEGEALQCLTERAMNWQDRARQAFLIEDVAAGLAYLNSCRQKKGDKSKNESSTEEKKLSSSKLDGGEQTTDGDLTESDLANDDSCGEDFNNIIFSRSEGEEEPQAEIDKESMLMASVLGSDDLQTNDLNTESSLLESNKPTSGGSEIEHAYSVPSLTGQSDVTPITTPNSNTSSIINTKARTPSPPIPFELKPSTLEILENLMLEGDLLEVSLDETNHIWKLLNLAKSQNTDAAASHVAQQSNNQKKRESKEFGSQSAAAARAFKKRQMLDGGASTTTTTPVKRLWKGSEANRKTIGKRDKKIKEGAVASAIFGGGDNTLDKLTDSEVGSGSVKPSPSSTAATTSAANVRKRKRAGGGGGGKSSARHDMLSMMNSTSDDDEECRAQNCHKPSGREVDWVQCDGGCNEWFHMFCVGLDRKQIKPDDDYICKRCMKSNAENNSSSSSSAVVTATPTQTNQQPQQPPSIIEASISSFVEKSNNVDTISPSSADVAIVQTTSVITTLSSTFSPTSTKPHKDIVS
ncbi:lysine-specific demethylase lid-like [Episyrphus balteatus]|uniref:lysine-specific demethylase lid-like n=1 Tax=Episyrphus balteatus TaxID=286459 RepID=UPI0024857625|nr:lysine-specific demethylase lid-like [Episyrphus balteatus]XP_055857758.1 lysine-specific demethylase lid-like [Episyrphus balteatus]